MCAPGNPIGPKNQILGIQSDLKEARDYFHSKLHPAIPPDMRSPKQNKNGTKSFG